MVEGLGVLPCKVLQPLLQKGNAICPIRLQGFALNYFLSQFGEPGIIHRASLVLKCYESFSDSWIKCPRALSTVTALISWESVMVQILSMDLVIRVTNCSTSSGTQGFPGLKELVTLLIKESKSECSHGLPKVLTDCRKKLEFALRSYSQGLALPWPSG